MCYSGVSIGFAQIGQNSLRVVSVDYPKPVFQSVVIDGVRFEYPFQTEGVDCPDPEFRGVYAQQLDAFLDFIGGPVSVGDCNDVLFVRS
jgi:hypothetical protein